MLELVALIIVLFGLNQIIITSLARKTSVIDPRFLNWLFVYHVFFAGVYYYYVQANASDSRYYFDFSRTTFLDWFGVLQDINGGVHFIAYPFIKGLGFNYEMMMILFAWIGYLGFILAYLRFREAVGSSVRIFGSLDLLTVLMFLPNMHFWTVSLGKGSVVFFALMSIFYGLASPKSRWFVLMVGIVVLYLIRPHVLGCMMGGVCLAAIFDRDTFTLPTKVVLLVVGGLLLASSTNTILQYAQIDSDSTLEEIVDQFQQKTSKQAEDLERKAGSGVSMTEYSLPLKLFTIWFRPLFVDSPNFLGHFSSIENLLYIAIFLQLFQSGITAFWRKSDFHVKFSIFSFLAVSFALTMVMSNLGIILRQKSMVMYFGFFVVYCFLAWRQSQLERLDLEYVENYR